MPEIEVYYLDFYFPGQLTRMEEELGVLINTENPASLPGICQTMLAGKVRGRVKDE